MEFTPAERDLIESYRVLGIDISPEMEDVIEGVCPVCGVEYMTAPPDRCTFCGEEMC